MGWVVNATPRPLVTPWKDPKHLVQEAGWAPGPVWTGVENLAPTGNRFPDRPARSQSLYRLSYHGPLRDKCVNKTRKACTIFTQFVLRFPSNMHTTRNSV